MRIYINDFSFSLRFKVLNLLQFLQILQLAFIFELSSYIFYMLVIFPEPTARSAVPGVTPGRGLLIPVLGEFKVDDGDEIYSDRWSSLIC